MLWFGNHIGEEELRCLAQHGIRARAKKLRIRVENVMVPHLQNNPDASRHIQPPAETPARSRIAPSIRHGMAHPSRRAIHLFRRFAARYTQPVNQSKQRPLAFTEIADLRSPVILLRVDVEMKVICPAHAARQAVIPDTLQGQRQRRVRARTGDGEIASILKEEPYQFRIVRAGLNCLPP